MHLSTAVVTLSTLSCASAKWHLHERATYSSRDWSLKSPAPEQHHINLHIGLQQPQTHVLAQELSQISDPDHARYGDHLTYDQAQKLSAPSQDAVDAVTQWLADLNINDYSTSPSLDFFYLRLPVAKLQEMLNTTYNVYQHTSGAEIVRTEEVHLPSQVAEHIELVQPSTYFGRFHEEAAISTIVQEASSKKSKSSAKACPKSNCSASVESACSLSSTTPECLKALYAYNGYVPKAPTKNLLGITGYLQQYANFADLKSFIAAYEPNQAGNTFSVVSVNNGTNSQSLEDAGSEANLDVQFGTSLVYPTKTTFYTTGGLAAYQSDWNTPYDSNEPYLEFLTYLLKQKTLPTVLTTSYGDDEQTVPVSYQQRVCNMYMQLGARGVSVIHASGDGGVTGGQPDGYCNSNAKKDPTRLLSTFPASCPYVTSVGATQASDTLGFAQEIAAPYSSGSFSETFARPSWQNAMIPTYIKNSGISKTYKNLFNPNGRGVPDVSAFGTFYEVYVGGELERLYGTSCSAPTFASVITLLNDKRLSEGRATLGFLNPWLYTKAYKALNDITAGSNPGCGYETSCQPTNCFVSGKPVKGFPAMAGWDAATGLGTPNLTKLMALV